MDSNTMLGLGVILFLMVMAGLLGLGVGVAIGFVLAGRERSTPPAPSATVVRAPAMDAAATWDAQLTPAPILSAPATARGAGGTLTGGLGHRPGAGAADLHLLLLPDDHCAGVDRQRRLMDC